MLPIYIPSRVQENLKAVASTWREVRLLCWYAQLFSEWNKLGSRGRLKWSSVVRMIRWHNLGGSYMCSKMALRI